MLLLLMIAVTFLLASIFLSLAQASYRGKAHFRLENLESEHWEFGIQAFEIGNPSIGDYPSKALG